MLGFRTLKPQFCHLAEKSVLAALLLLPACERLSPQEAGTVHGYVHFLGEPLAGGRVVFTPDAERGNTGKPINSEIAVDGHYQLTGSGQAAIPAGWYRVAIAPSPSCYPSATRSRAPFPLSLARPDTSGIVRNIKPGEENRLDFAIDAHPN